MARGGVNNRDRGGIKGSSGWTGVLSHWQGVCPI
jgi:hypothetical protein